MASKPTSGPLVVYRGLALLLRLGLAFWLRVLGKRTKAFIITGLVLSTIAALILEEKL